jgi:hypothetical protein
MAYDSKSVKVPKSVKCVAATIKDKHLRGAFIKMHVKQLESEAHTRVSRNRGNRD